jgi:hypothetical protein
MAVVIDGNTGITTPTSVFTDSSGNVGIGCTPASAYQLDVQNPSTAASAKTYIRLKSNAVSGDGDALIYLDGADTGEVGLVLMNNGVVGSYIETVNGGDYVAITNELSGADLTMYGANVASNDAYSLRYLRTTGVAPVTGITGTITASLDNTTITGLSTTTGLYKGMLLTKTAGTGVLATGTYITSVDAGTSTVTIQSGVGAMTAGSITFTATPTPVTISAYNSGASSSWAVDQDFARFAFCNGDTSGAGDAGIKASINAYVYDTAGTGAGLDFYVSSDGTTLTKAVRMDQTGIVTGTAGNLMLVSDTAISPVSGTTLAFPSIPSWVKRITISISGVSFAASGVAVVRLGVSNVLVTTGYVAARVGFTTTPAMVYTSVTDGIASFGTTVAAAAATGQIVITNLTGNQWVASGQVTRTTDNVYMPTTGSITLAGTLTNLSLVATTSTFDAGAVNIMYE